MSDFQLQLFTEEKKQEEKIFQDIFEITTREKFPDRGIILSSHFSFENEKSAQNIKIIFYKDLKDLKINEDSIKITAFFNEISILVGAENNSSAFTDKSSFEQIKKIKKTDTDIFIKKEKKDTLNFNKSLSMDYDFHIKYTAGIKEKLENLIKAILENECLFSKSSSEKYASELISRMENEFNPPFENKDK